MPNAVRQTDLHICPASFGMTACVGGSLLVGSPNVMVNNLPAIRQNDAGICTGTGMPNTVISGSSTILINNIPAAISGSIMAHGGQICSGSPNVLIGG